MAIPVESYDFPVRLRQQIVSDVKATDKAGKPGNRARMLHA